MNFSQQNVILKLTLKAFRANRKDKSATAALASDKSANASQVSVTKRLVPETVFKKVYEHDRASYAIFNRQTMPWCDGTEAEGDDNKSNEPAPAGRICRASIFAKLMAEMGERERGRLPLVEEGIKAYAELIAHPERLREQLGELYDPEDYPEVREVERAFRFQVRVMQVPGNDWRVEMQKDELRQVREMAMAQTREAAAAAERRLVEEISKPLTRVLEMLRKPEGERRIVQASLDNLRDIGARISALNVTDNPVFTEIQQAIQNGALTASAPDLRVSQSCRSRARTEAQTLLEKLAGLTGEVAEDAFLSTPDSPEPTTHDDEQPFGSDEDQALATLMALA